MKSSLMMIVLFALTSSAAADEWKAVVWTYSFHFSRNGDSGDLEKIVETEYATEKQCLFHLQTFTSLTLQSGVEVYSELTKFGSEGDREPFWRLQLQDSDDEKFLESYSCVRTVLFTLIREDD